MDGVSVTGRTRIDPKPEEIEEAKARPGGWVYRIEGTFARDEHVPKEAVVGAWRVDVNGRIVGDFMPNPNYRPGTKSPT
jgi:hypothetical protein